MYYIFKIMYIYILNIIDADVLYHVILMSHCVTLVKTLFMSVLGK